MLIDYALIIGLIIFISYIIIIIIISIAKQIIGFINNKKRQKVKLHSRRLRELEALNSSTSFIDVDGKYINRKHYDNKSNYKKVELAYIMAADIRENLNYYYDICEKINKNREIYSTYMQRVNQINTYITEQECEELKISISNYKSHEETLFQETLLKPVIDYSYTVIATYSSPKGQVNLSKEESFNMENILACMESVSRSRLDRNTYSKLSMVERAEVSDSMRYDILVRDGFKCVICGASAKDGAHLHVDHIIPVAKGGKSIPSNLRTLCERCNIGKSDKLEDVNSKEVPSKEDELLCPRCGGKLVIRAGSYGPFYGCSNYPKCKYTRTINN